MKQIILSIVIACFMGCGILSAQTPQSQTEKKEFNYEELMERRIDRMQKSLVLDDKAAAQFAPLYKEYLQALKGCYSTCPVKDRQNLTDTDREKRIQHQFDCRQKMLDTQKNYYAKFKKFLNASQLEKVFCPTREDARSGDFHKRHYERRGRNSSNCNDTYHHRHYSSNCVRH